MTIRDFLRTSIFRISVSCTLGFIGALMALSAAFYFAGTAYWHAEIEEAVEDEYEVISAAYTSGGTQAVSALIQRRAVAVTDEGYIYLLQAPGWCQAGRSNADDEPGRGLVGDRSTKRR
jgi:hypothetical protein